MLLLAWPVLLPALLLLSVVLLLGPPTAVLLLAVVLAGVCVAAATFAVAAVAAAAAAWLVSGLSGSSTIRVLKAYLLPKPFFASTDTTPVLVGPVSWNMRCRRGALRLGSRVS